MNVTQSWAKGMPTYFVNGKRVSLELGINCFISNGFSIPEVVVDSLNKHGFLLQPSIGAFAILNEVERPDQFHVCQIEKKGKQLVGKYMHKSLRDWGDVEISDDCVDMHDFGFDVEINNGVAHFTKKRSSIAKYKDLKTRRWQGINSFKLMIWFDLVSFLKA